jgi:hypothetical protein
MAGYFAQQATARTCCASESRRLKMSMELAGDALRAARWLSFSARNVGSSMSTTPTITTTPPRKMSPTQAKVRLRRRLEDYLEKTWYQSAAERRFIQAMIDLLYCIGAWDKGSEAIINSVGTLMLKGQLRDIFSRSTSEYTKYGVVVRIESPSKMNRPEQAIVRFRRRLEDYLEEIPYQNGAERRFIQAMIDLLYCIRTRDKGSDEIINSVRKLMLKGRLRDIFSSSKSERTEYGELVVRVESPSGPV